MEAIPMMFGGLALLVSLAALWFANDVTRRIEEQTHAFMDTQILPLKQAIGRVSAQLKQTETQVATLESHAKSDKKENKEGRERLQELFIGMQKLNEEFAKLDQSIPSRYRTTAAGGPAATEPRRGDKGRVTEV